MQHRTTVDAIETPQGYVVRWPGGLVETIPGERFLQMFPPAPAPLPQPPATEPRVVVGVTPTQPQPVQDEHEPEDRTTRICIECGDSTPDIMPSGKCFRCATVRCPTCGAAAKRIEMSGSYCPACLGGRKPRTSMG